MKYIVFFVVGILLFSCKDSDSHGSIGATSTTSNAAKVKTTSLEWLGIDELDNLNIYLAENYHLIKFNAEQKEPIQYNGRTYEWKAGGRKGYNTLARDMLEGQMSYPSMVYYNEDKIKIIAVPGYKKPAQLLSDIERVQKLPM